MRRTVTMAKKVQDIQAVIEERANNKLNRDMAAMCQTVRSLPLFRDMYDGQRPEVYVKFPAQGAQPEKFVAFTIPALFNGEVNRNNEFSGSLWLKGVREKWLTEYITRETQDFFQRLDKLEGDVNDLMNAKIQENDY